MTTGSETKTIMEFLAESPDVDVSRAWERCWGIHSKIVERVQEYSWRSGNPDVIVR